MPQGAHRARRIPSAEEQQRLAQFRRVARGKLLHQREHARALGGVAPVARIRPRRPEQVLGFLQAAAIQRDPTLRRQRVHAGIAREHRVGEVQLTPEHARPCELEAQRRAVVPAEPGVGSEPPAGLVEPTVVDQRIDQRPLRERLCVGRGRGIALDVLQHLPRGCAVAGGDEGTRRLRPCPDGERVGNHVRVPGEGERANAARLRRTPRARDVREPPQRGCRLRGRGSHRRLEQGPRALRLTPVEEQLGRQPACERRRIAGRELSHDPLPALLRGLGEPARGRGELGRRLGERTHPLPRCAFPVPAAL